MSILARAALPLLLTLSAGWGKGAVAGDIFSDTTYFPIAVWLQDPSNASAYKAAGINLYIGLWEGPTKEQLDKLKSVGMPVLCDQNQFALTNLSAYGGIIAGWLHGDEPDNAQDDGNGGYGPCISPDTIIKKYSAWKSKCPDLPVILNLGQGVSNIDYVGRGSACHARTDMYPKYLQGCDLVSFDIYPVNSSYAAIKGNLWYVAKGIDSLRLWGGDKKPAWSWIECTRIDSSSSAAPTPDQVKSEVWMALIHGAKGFGYFCHSWYGGFKEAGWLTNTQMKTAITAINSRVSTIAPVLNSPSVPCKVTVSTDVASAPIDIMVKVHAGCTYIFAAAMRNSAVKVTFSSTCLGKTATVEVLDENRTLTATNGAFQDDFKGFGVHLYKINTGTGIGNHHGARIFPLSPRAPKPVPMLKAGGGFYSADANNRIAKSVYTIQGILLKRNFTPAPGSVKMPDGIYIIH